MDKELKRWKTVGLNVKMIYEGLAIEDVLHRIPSIDKALPTHMTAVILERLFERFGCYVDWLHRKYVLCDRPLGAYCRQRGRLYWCVIEPPWFFSEQPLPGCVRLSNGFLCVRKDPEAALQKFEKRDCNSALAAMPGRKAEVGDWILYVSDGEVYECNKIVSIYRIRQECSLAERCGSLWRISRRSAIAYEVAGGRTYVVWQKPTVELLREIYVEEKKAEL